MMVDGVLYDFEGGSFDCFGNQQAQMPVGRGEGMDGCKSGIYHFWHARLVGLGCGNRLYENADSCMDRIRSECRIELELIVRGATRQTDRRTDYLTHGRGI